MRPPSGKDRRPAIRPSASASPLQPGDLSSFIDISSDDQNAAVWQAPAECSDQRIARADLNSLRNRDSCTIPSTLSASGIRSRLPARPTSVSVEQARELDSPGILPEMIRDRVGEAIRWQPREKTDPRTNHAIGPCDQIAVDLQIHEPEQPDHEYGKCRRDH